VGRLAWPDYHPIHQKRRYKDMTIFQTVFQWRAKSKLLCGYNQFFHPADAPNQRLTESPNSSNPNQSGVKFYS
jgi:hypothetical protein